MMLGANLAVIAQEPETHQPVKHLTIHADGADRAVTTTADTVKGALADARVTMRGYDRVSPAEGAPVTDGMTIVVTRVVCEIVRERVPAPVPTITRWDRRMTTTPVVLREGKAGVIEQTRVMWKKDGVISLQWTQNPRVIVQSVARIVVRGNIPSRGPGNRRVLTMVSTAYDPGPASCGRHANGYTAIGLRATRGVVAVDPKVIPLGSRVYVEGYGAAIAGDTGGAIKGNRIDVCFPTRAEALRWGRRTVTVVVLQ
ncbi:MAG TPA: 3D domain-containing protein [Armatimonadota bacterium]|nr:3D domain-containing protein [Armatimonadota bacterium]